jgi:hypothetical protein
MKVSFSGLTAALTAGLLLASGCAARQSARISEPATSPLAEAPVAEPQPFPDETTAAKTTPSAGETVVAKASPPGNERIVMQTPPAPHVEVVGAPPGPEYVWMPGVWQWHEAWAWAPGRWGVRPRPNAVWISGQWTRYGHGWVWIRGYWR